MHGNPEADPYPQKRALRAVNAMRWFRWAVIGLLAVAVLIPVTTARPSRAASVAASPAQMQAAYDKVVSADDGMSVYDPLRGETLFATGDAIMVNGIDYSKSWGYPHMVWVAQTGPATFTPLRLYQATVPNHYGWQPVPDPGTPGNRLPVCPAGNIFWAGGLLYAAGARQIVDYGGCVNPSGTSSAGSYAALFDAATLRFEGLRPLGMTEGWSDAVAVTGGWWMLGSRLTGPPNCLADCFTGDSAFIPAGDQLRPAYWRITRGTVPAGANPGSVITPFLYGGRWNAVTKAGDAYGSTIIVELAAARPGGLWARTGKSWPTSGSNTYSVVWHGGYVTYASQVPYQTSFEAVSP